MKRTSISPMSRRRRRGQLLLFCAILSTLLVSIDTFQTGTGPDKVTSNEIQGPNSISDGTELPCGIGYPSTPLNASIFTEFDAGPGEYPWMVNMALPDDTSFCSGVIIDERHILTTKQCIVDASITIEQFMSYNFYIGDYDWSRVDGEQTVHIERVILKNPTSNDTSDDIALLKTNETMKFTLTKDKLGSVNRICMPRFDFKFEVGLKVIDGRWDFGKLSPKLKEFDVFIKKCREQKDQLSSYTLCATVNNGKADCSGDTGSPLFVQTTTGQFQLAGISQDLFCKNDSQDGIYANVMVHLEWIDKNL